MQAVSRELDRNPNWQRISWKPDPLVISIPSDLPFPRDGHCPVVVLIKAGTIPAERIVWNGHAVYPGTKEGWIILKVNRKSAERSGGPYKKGGR